MDIIPPQSQFKRMTVSSELDDGANKQAEKRAHANPWRERRVKSLLKSIKLRIAGEQFEEDIEDDDMTDDHDSPVPATMTWELLQVVLPNLSSRPYSSLQRLNWQDGAKNAGEKSEEKKSSTLPIMKPSSRTNYVSDAEKPFVDNMAITIPETFQADSESLSERQVINMNLISCTTRLNLKKQTQRE